MLKLNSYNISNQKICEYEKLMKYLDDEKLKIEKKITLIDEYNLNF